MSCRQQNTRQLSADLPSEPIEMREDWAWKKRKKTRGKYRERVSYSSFRFLLLLLLLFVSLSQRLYWYSISFLKKKILIFIWQMNLREMMQRQQVWSSRSSLFRVPSFFFCLLTSAVLSELTLMVIKYEWESCRFSSRIRRTTRDVWYDCYELTREFLRLIVSRRRKKNDKSSSCSSIRAPMKNDCRVCILTSRMKEKENETQVIDRSEQYNSIENERREKARARKRVVAKDD